MYLPSATFKSLKCENISDEGNGFFINGEVMPFTNVFKYLRVEMKRDGIDYKAYLKRRTDEYKRAAVSKSNPLHNSSLTYLYNTLLKINKTRLDNDPKSKTPLMYPSTNERHNIPNPNNAQ
jgi:hypothetical protein